MYKTIKNKPIDYLKMAVEEKKNFENKFKEINKKFTFGIKLNQTLKPF